MVDKRTPHVYVEFEAKFGELWCNKRTIHVYVEFEAKFGELWCTKKNTKVTLRYGTGVALTLSAVHVDILRHKCCVCVDSKRDHGGQENTSRLCGI